MRTVRRDPAPTRVAYRLQRLWMRPAARLALRVGLPAAIMAGAGAWHLSEPSNVARLKDRAAELRLAVEDHPRLRVERLEVAGADATLVAEIRTVLPLALPESRLRLDRAGLRAAAEALPRVREASLALTDRTLVLTVAPRLPVALHRGAEGLHVIDAEGVRLAAVDRRSDRPGLPLVAGPGAGEAAAEALDVLAAAGPLAPHVAGLVRRGGRRWDVVLGSGQRILLPAEGPAAAMRRAARRADVFTRAVIHLDLRVPGRAVLRRLPILPEA